MESLLAPPSSSPQHAPLATQLPWQGATPGGVCPPLALAVYLVSQRRRNLGMFFFLLAFHLQRSGSRS